MVRVEVDVSKGMPAFDIVGLPDAAVRESRERVRTAIRNSGLEFPFERITVNHWPACCPGAGGAAGQNRFFGRAFTGRQPAPGERSFANVPRIAGKRRCQFGVAAAKCGGGRFARPNRGLGFAMLASVC